MARIKSPTSYKWRSVTGLELLTIPRAKADAKPVTMTDDWLEEIKQIRYADSDSIGITDSVFDYYGQGHPEEVTAIELEDNAWFVVANNSIAFCGTFASDDRIDVRYWVLTNKK